MMRQTRIHVDQVLQADVDIQLGPAAAEHVARVLRMHSGDNLILFNGDGSDYSAVVTAVERRMVHVRITALEAVRTEAPFPLLLAQALARADKMDLVIQKAVELGATSIVPLVTEHSNVRLDADRAARRVAHWQAVAISACGQSGRARIPAIAAVQSLGKWCASLANTPAIRLALLPQAQQRIRNLQINANGALLVVGPEGGLSQTDIRVLEEAGFTGLSLGPRILRTETAGLTALAALQAIHGDL